MRENCLRVFFVGILFLIAPTAHADIDQHCLKQCVENGGTSSACLPQCSYNVPLVDPTVKTSPQTHRVLTTPQPLAGDQIVLPPKIAHSVPDKDYSCMAQCLQNGGAVYHACEERCTIPDCPPGVTLCRNSASLPTTTAPITPTVNAIPPSYR